MDEEQIKNINFAIGIANLVKTTLGPRGMNKMVISDGKIKCMTNDGATIIGNLRGGNPIVELFKQLAQSQEEVVGDGTTTATIFAGQLLENALSLVNKGIHPTTIINGYSLAKMRAIEFINKTKRYADLDKIIKTSFGTKLPKEIIEHLTSLLLRVKDPINLKMMKIANRSPLESELFEGWVFQGFTINDRMKDQFEGKIAVMDFPISLKMDKFSVTSAEEMEKIQEKDTDMKKRIVEKLKENNVGWIFYTDTTPEFESYLTDAGITGVVIWDRSVIDNICKACNAVAISGINQIEAKRIGDGKVRYIKSSNVKDNSGLIYLSGNFETLVLKGSTEQFLEEMNDINQKIILN